VGGACSALCSEMINANKALLVQVQCKSQRERSRHR